MLKLNKLADYATVVLTTLATAPARLLNSQALSAQTHIPAPTVAKVLKALIRAGLVTSSRGLHGGYQLARPPATITIADVVEALEGPIALTDCATHGSGCDIAGDCKSRQGLRLIDKLVRSALASVSLADMLRAEMETPEIPMQFHRLPTSPGVSQQADSEANRKSL